MARSPIFRISREPESRERLKGRRARFPAAYPSTTQASRLGDTFRRFETGLADLLNGADVSTRPAEVSPDRALVFDVIGPVANFVAVARAVGLEWLAEDYGIDAPGEDGEEEDPEDSEYDQPSTTGQNLLYVTMPTIAGLQRIISLWNRYSRGQPRPAQDGGWWRLFGYLSEVRTWSAKDRVDPQAAAYVERRLRRYPDRPVCVELDLWFREDPDLRAAARSYVVALMETVGGTLLDFATIEPIRYQAALVEISGEQARRLGALQGPIADADKIMRVRPQSLFSTEPHEPAPVARGVQPPPLSADPRDPIAAVLDGYPIQNHYLLANRVDVEEVDVTGAMAPVARRFHGTAMASLVIHGDLGASEPPLDRVVKVVPILAAAQGLHEECTPADKLPIAMVYRAVVALMEGLDGGEPLGERVVIINHSICDQQAPFVRRASPWAKLLDYLSHYYDLLFVVSAGNPNPPFAIDTYATCHGFETADPIERQIVLLRSIEQAKGVRLILSPAEAINALTVGAVHEDASGECPANLVDPFAASGVTNIASGIGLGVNRAIKPEIVEAGGRQLAAAVAAVGGGVEVWARDHGDVGQLAASPDPTGGTTSKQARSTGTSNATALVTRSAIRIADVVEQIFAETGDDWNVSPSRAVILKALLAHGCRWGETGTLLESVYEGTWQRKRETISRFLGYGRHDLSRTMRADGARITLLADDMIKTEARHEYVIPIPRAMVGNRELRRIVMTLAWSSPIEPSSNRYRGVIAEIVDADGKRKFWRGVKGTLQPHPEATRRGTLQHLVLEGRNLVREAETGSFRIGVQARAVLPEFAAEDVPYALALTLELAQPVRTDLFDDVRTRVRPRQRTTSVRTPVRVRARTRA